MSSVMRPVGDKPPNVYWRRRAVVLAVMLVIALLVAWLISSLIGGGGDSEQAAVSPSPTTVTETTTATASPTDSPTDGTETAAAVAECGANDLAITATSAARTVTVGQDTTIGMTIQNSGESACKVDAGSANLELLITSGSERIWSSDDCQRAAENRETEVEPGAKLQSEVPWAVERSAEGCATGLSTLRPGTYQLTAKVGDLTSEPLTLTVES